MSFSSNAVLAKARSMYGKHLTPESYDELLKKRTVNDVVSYLKSETAYGPILEGLKETNIHRGQLESLLDEEEFLRAIRLIHYAPKGDQKFYQLGIIRREIAVLLSKVRLFNSDETLNSELDIPSYLPRYSTFDLYGLLSIEDYPSLLRYMEKTRYYHILQKYMPVDDEKIDTNMMELDFKRAYYMLFVETVKSTFKGKKQKDLLTMIYTQIELENITKIYRFKRFFNSKPEQIKKQLILDYSRIPQSVMNELIETKDAEEFLKKLASSPYKLYVDDQEFVYIEYYTDKIKYNLAKRYMRFTTDAAMVYMTYLIVFENEVENLKHIIEGLRYGEEAEKIAQLLIY